MSRLLEGNTAVVTGAGAGIGRAIARAFAREGARVIVAEKNVATGEQVAAELAEVGSPGDFVAIDVTDVHSVRVALEGVLEREGCIDILVNNAYPTMAFPPENIHELSEDRLHSSMVAGFFAASMAMQVVFPAMQRSGFGRVINICSLNGVNAHKYSADYNSAKEALRAYTRTAAVEWASFGITANVICPGAATTPYKALADFNPGLAESLKKAVPMGRMGDPEKDIAPVAVFLASHMAGYMTGNTLFVDGGGHINGVPWDPDVVA